MCLPLLIQFDSKRVTYSHLSRLGPCFSGLSPPILCYMPSPYGRTDEYGLTMFHQWHLTYADFGGLCSTPVNPCGFDVPRGQRRIRSRSVRLTSRRWPQPCLGHALLGLYTFAYAALSSAHPSPHLGLGDVVLKASHQVFTVKACLSKVRQNRCLMGTSPILLSMSSCRTTS